MDWLQIYTVALFCLLVCGSFLSVAKSGGAGVTIVSWILVSPIFLRVWGAL